MKVSESQNKKWSEMRNKKYQQRQSLRGKQALGPNIPENLLVYFGGLLSCFLFFAVLVSSSSRWRLPDPKAKKKWGKTKKITPLKKVLGQNSPENPLFFPYVL